MKKKSIITLSIVTFGLIIASWALAQKVDKKDGGSLYRGHPGEFGRPGECRGDKAKHERGKKHKGEGRFNGRIGSFLDLTVDQQAKIDKIRAENDKSAQKMHDDIAGLKEKMRAEWRAAKPNKQALLDLHKKMADLRNKLAEQRIAERIDIIALLTPEQRVKNREDGRGYHRGFEGRGKHRGAREGRQMNRKNKGFEGKGRALSVPAPTPANS